MEAHHVVALLSASDPWLGPYAARLRLSHTTTEIANAVRHALLKDVSIAASASVTLLAYDGPVEAELVAHRFGQLPIALLDTDNASTLDGVAGAGASAGAGAGAGSGADAIATFEACVINEGTALRWVTSKDLVCVSGRARVVHYRSAAEEAAAGSSGFLVCPLLPGQRLYARANVAIGSVRSRDARWGAVFVRMVPTELHDDGVSDEAPDAAPPTEYDFYVETNGAVTALGAWRQALTALGTQLKSIAGGATVRALEAPKFAP